MFEADRKERGRWLIYRPICSKHKPNAGGSRGAGGGGGGVCGRGGSCGVGCSRGVGGS
jgi:hypothetical protein